MAFSSDFVSNPRTKRFPSFPIAASLPVTISRGGFWPSGELMDNEANDSNRLEPSRAKNVNFDLVLCFFARVSYLNVSF